MGESNRKYIGWAADAEGGGVTNAERKLGFAMKSKANIDEHNRRVAEEAKKSKRRGMWGSIGSILGAIVGVALAPVTGGMSLLASSAVVGGSALAGSYIVGKSGREIAKASGSQVETIGTEEDAFTEKISGEASDEFHSISEQEEKDLVNQALISGLTAGTLHGLGGGVGSDAGFLKGGDASKWTKATSFGGKFKQNIGAQWMGSGGAAKSGGMMSMVGKSMGQVGALSLAKMTLTGQGTEEEPRQVQAPEVRVNYA